MIKSRIMRGTLIISLSVILLLVVVMPVLAFSYPGYCWSADSTSYEVVSGISNYFWRTAIYYAGSTWNDAGADFSFDISASSAHDWGTENLGNNGVLATTYITRAGSVITDCDTKFNIYYDFYTDGSDYDVETIALHEFGHWLTLGHVYSDSTIVMYYTYVGVKQDLSDDDVDGIIYIYGED